MLLKHVEEGNIVFVAKATVQFLLKQCALACGWSLVSAACSPSLRMRARPRCLAPPLDVNARSLHTAEELV